MREWNQLRRTLGRLDRGDARCAQHVALLCGTGADQRERFGAHRNPAAGASEPARNLLARDIDHVRLPGRVEMGKM